MTSWDEFWATIPSSPGERRTAVHVADAFSVTHRPFPSSLYDLTPANLVGGGDALRDASDATHVHFGEQILLTRFDEVRGTLVAADIPAAARDVVLDYGLRWRGGRTLGGSGSLSLTWTPSVWNPPPAPTGEGTADNFLLSRTRPGGYGGSYPEAQYGQPTQRLEARATLAGTSTTVLTGEVLEAMRAGGLGWTMAINGAPNADPAFYVDLLEVFIAARYTLGRTPLRGRQRTSGVTGSIPLRGRNQQPYGLRGRQNADL